MNLTRDKNGNISDLQFSFFNSDLSQWNNSKADKAFEYTCVLNSSIMFLEKINKLFCQYNKFNVSSKKLEKVLSETKNLQEDMSNFNDTAKEIIPLKKFLRNGREAENPYDALASYGFNCCPEQKIIKIPIISENHTIYELDKDQGLYLDPNFSDYILEINKNFIEAQEKGNIIKIRRRKKRDYKKRFKFCFIFII